MRKSFCLPVFFTTLWIVGSLLAGEVEESEKIEKTFRFENPNGKNQLVVDNVFGSISVTGYDGEEVEMRATKTIPARSAQRTERVGEEVYLDIIQEDDFVELYVDGPFRDHQRRSGSRSSWRRRNDSVRFDFELRVPRATDLILKTVNDGEVMVKGIDGNYEVENVNGGIVMEAIGGSGDVYAVNGDVTVYFRKNPETDCRFGTLNGELRLYFHPNLSAAFQLKTFNGEVYSDFDATYLPHKLNSTVERNGKTVYKTGRTTGVQVGTGGPEILLDGFNGDMFILRKK